MIEGPKYVRFIGTPRPEGPSGTGSKYVRYIGSFAPLFVGLTERERGRGNEPGKREEGGANYVRVIVSAV